MSNITGCGTSAAKVNRRVGVKFRVRSPDDVPWEQLRREIGRAWDRLCERKPVYRRYPDPVFDYSSSRGRKVA